MLASDMPDSEKSGERLREEAYVLVVAGAETTAGTLAAITYQLLSNPAMFRKLKAELETAMPDPDEHPVASKLEGLPYLVRFIQPYRLSASTNTDRPLWFKRPSVAIPVFRIV